MENSLYLKGDIRNLTFKEQELVFFLLKESEFVENIDVNCLKVMEMNDGGMGSLYFVSETKLRTERRFGRILVEKTFEDTDGMGMSISLFLDTEGELFELDIWKFDFSPLNEIPSCNDL